MVSEHSSVAKNINSLRVFLKDMLENEDAYKTATSRVMEYSLAFKHSLFGGVSMVFQVSLDLDGHLIKFTGIDIAYADTSRESKFMQNAQALRLGVLPHLNLARGVVVNPSKSLLDSPHVTHLAFRTMLQKDQIMTIITELLCYDVKSFANRNMPEVLWKEAFGDQFQEDHC